MVASNWKQAFDWVMQSEGAEINISPNEPGGISKYGVSLQTYAEWCKKQGKAKPTFDTIKNMDKPTAMIFYKSAFADVFRFDQLASGVDYRMFDVSVNLGINGGIKLLAAVVGEWSTLDPAVIVKAANKISARQLCPLLGAGWIAIKSTRDTWQYKTVDGKQVKGYGHGWINRRNFADTNALKLITGG